MTKLALCFWLHLSQGFSLLDTEYYCRLLIELSVTSFAGLLCKVYHAPLNAQ